MPEDFLRESPLFYIVDSETVDLVLEGGNHPTFGINFN